MGNIEKSEAQILLYSMDNSNVYVDVYFKDETFWLTQKSMAELFDCSSDNISLHLKNIYDEEELNKASTTEEFSVVRIEGNRNEADDAYQIFRVRQDMEYISEFDKDMEKYFKGKP